jgi:hypothetical protein
MLRVLALAVAASALNITYYHGNTASSILPYASLAALHVRRNIAEIVLLLADTGRSTVWKLVEAVALEGDTFELEGMVRLTPDRIAVSAGEYTAPTVPYGKDANGSAIIVNGTDRANGAGFAHLLSSGSTSVRGSELCSCSSSAHDRGWADPLAARRICFRLLACLVTPLVLIWMHATNYVTRGLLEILHIG